MAANFLTSFNKWPDANRYSQRNFIKAEERLRCCIRLRVTVNQQVSNSIESLYIHLRFPFYHFLYWSVNSLSFSHFLPLTVRFRSHFIVLEIRFTANGTKENIAKMEIFFFTATKKSTHFFSCRIISLHPPSLLAISLQNTSYEARAFFLFQSKMRLQIIIHVYSSILFNQLINFFLLFSLWHLAALLSSLGYLFWAFSFLYKISFVAFVTFLYNLQKFCGL